MSPILTGVIASGISGNLTPPWSPEGAYDALAATTVNAGGSSFVEFSGIPANYKHLQIHYIARSTSVNPFSNLLNIRFNGDSSNNYYSQHRITGRGDGLVYANAGSQTSSAMVGFIAGGGTSSNVFTAGIIDILDINSTLKNKVIRSRSFLVGQSTSTENDITFNSSMWFPSGISSINSFAFTSSADNIAEGSNFQVYGIK